MITDVQTAAIKAAVKSRDAGDEKSVVIDAALDAARAVAKKQAQRGENAKSVISEAATVNLATAAARAVLADHSIRSATLTNNQRLLLNMWLLRINAGRRSRPPVRKVEMENMPTDSTLQSSFQEEDLWRYVLEAPTNDSGINTPYVVRLYIETIKINPILRLLRDTSERIGIYHNLLEDVKKQYSENGEKNSPTTAQLLKQKYEGLQLVPIGQLPNPWAHETAALAMKKLRQFGNLLLEIMASYADEIAKELKVSPEVTLTFEVDLALAPSVKIGIERAGSMNRAAQKI